MNLIVSTIIAMLVIGLLFGYLYYNKFRIRGISYNSVVVWVSVIFLTFLNGFRNPKLKLCVDYGNYVYEYAISPRLSVKEAWLSLRREPVFWVLEKFINKISGGNVIVFMVTVAFITLFFITRYFSKYSEDSWFSLFLLISIGSYWTSFNTMRNFLAIAVLMISVKFIINRKPTKFVIVVLVSTMIHRSMIAFLPFYFLLNLNWGSYKKRLNNIVIFMTLIIAVVTAPIVLTFILTRYYPDASLASSRASILNAFRPTIIAILGLATLKQIDWKNNEDRVYINALLFFFICAMMSLRSEVFIRFSYMFLPIVICEMPIVFKRIKGYNRRVFFTILTIFSISYGVMTNYHYEYYTYWMG